MIRDGVQHDGEGQDMTPHNEDKEDDLRGAKDLTADRTEQDFAGVGHVVDVRVAELELPDYEAGVGCQGAQADDEDHASVWGASSQDLASLALGDVREDSRHESDRGQH